MRGGTKGGTDTSVPYTCSYQQSPIAINHRKKPIGDWHYGKSQSEMTGYSASLRGGTTEQIHAKLLALSPPPHRFTEWEGGNRGSYQFLFHQQHSFHIGKTFSLHAIEINTARYISTVVINSIPVEFVSTSCHVIIHESINSLTSDIKYIDSD